MFPGPGLKASGKRKANKVAMVVIMVVSPAVGFSMLNGLL